MFGLCFDYKYIETDFYSGPKNPNNPYSCVCLHGDRSPNERKDNLAKFKAKNCKFLICTDVAARGLDISGVIMFYYSYIFILEFYNL
jgi:superfamily II DNA/RNA helicase